MMTLIYCSDGRGLALRLCGADLRIGAMVRAVRQNPASAMAAKIPVYNVPTLGVGVTVTTIATAFPGERAAISKSSFS